MLNLQNISYSHPNKSILFEQLQLHLQPRQKMALIGNNGVGKSTLLRIIAGELSASSGCVKTTVKPYYVPQLVGQFTNCTVARVLRIDKKWRALQAILNGDVSEAQLDALEEDWSIEERCKQVLANWQLSNLDLQQSIEKLSGGEKAKLLLAGMELHQPELVLLDEPSNHLDLTARGLLYDFLGKTTAAMLVVSHDRNLLNLLDLTGEMTSSGIQLYGGNYDFFEQQKQLERQAMEQAIGAAEKALRQAREIERETKERQQKLNSRGKDKQEKAGIAKIMMNSLRNSAERTSAKLKEVHAEKMQGLKEELLQRRAAKPAILSMKFDWEESGLHQGKRLFSATAMNYEYHPGQPVWKNPLNWQVNSGERWALKGNNGTGKTTLLKLILGQLKASGGIVYRADFKAIYLDQDYSLINSKQTVFERACAFNKQGLEDHHIKNRLHRFLFEKADWEITCSSLSGGERMRLLLCCLHISQQAPDLIVLDEPTNNLDLDNLEILANAIRQYKGSLLVVSHDSRFLEDIQVTRELVLR